MDIFYTEQFLKRFEGSPSKYDTILQYFKNENRESTMKDFARIVVYVVDNQAIQTRESPEYEPSHLVSDIGGQLGVWIGISIITLMEVIELFMVLIGRRVCCRLRPSRNSRWRFCSFRRTVRNRWDAEHKKYCKPKQ